jgi:transcriptional regulator with XRE-family HTH domain
MISIDLITIGARLKEIRLCLGFKQSEVAQKIGVKQNTVARLEKGGAISASVFANFLAFYSTYTSLDVVFDDKAWLIAQEEKSMLLKKVHLDSVVKEKMILMKKNMAKEIGESKSRIIENLRELESYLNRGLNSTISMMEDE